ncbi:MAG TPA: hypothetical protein VLA13_11105 [Massilibacterium sp.]|nr:hypothetical protein [Massilibacterium sp.]
MSKERLEDIVYNVGVSLDGEKAIVSGEHYDFLYNYAIQQTERVEELEEINTDAITQIDVMQKRNERLEKRVQELEGGLAYYKMATESYLDIEQQNKRYREALDKQFKEFWEACVKVVGEDMAYDIVAEMPEEGEE